MSAILQTRIDPARVIMCHTPMRALAAKYGNSPVLVAGYGSTLKVAHSYGFSKAVSPHMIAHSREDGIYSKNKEVSHDAFHASAEAGAIKSRVLPLSHEPLAAAFVLSDSVYWGLEAQVLLDVLTSDGLNLGVPVASQQVPLYFGNMDFLWSNQFPKPRLGQGSFNETLKFLYEKLTGRSLQYTAYGKPTRAHFNYATEVVRDQARALGVDSLQHIYMIGDNPEVDIKGANDAGSPWVSVFVHSGSIQERPDICPSLRAKDVVGAMAEIAKHANFSALLKGGFI